MSSHHTTGIVHHPARKCTVTTKGDRNCCFAVAAAARAMSFCFAVHLKFTSYQDEQNPWKLF